MPAYSFGSPPSLQDDMALAASPDAVLNPGPIAPSASSAKVFGVAAKQNIGGAAVGFGGAMLGGELGLLGGPAAPITVPLGAIIGGILGGIGGSKLQSAIDPTYAEDAAFLAEQTSEHPWAVATGTLAPNLVAFRPSLSALKQVASIPNTVRMARAGGAVGGSTLGNLTREQVGALTNVGMGVGLAGVPVATSLVEGRPINKEQLITDLAAGLLMTQPQPWMKAVGMHPSLSPEEEAAAILDTMRLGEVAKTQKAEAGPRPVQRVPTVDDLELAAQNLQRTKGIVSPTENPDAPIPVLTEDGQIVLVRKNMLESFVDAKGKLDTRKIPAEQASSTAALPIGYNLSRSPQSKKVAGAAAKEWLSLLNNPAESSALRRGLTLSPDIRQEMSAREMQEASLNAEAAKLARAEEQFSVEGAGEPEGAYPLTASEKLIAGLKGTWTKESRAKQREFAAKQRFVNIADQNPEMPQAGKYTPRPTGELPAQIETGKGRTVETEFHELSGHDFLDYLKRSPREQDNRLHDILEKQAANSPEYTEWKQQVIDYNARTSDPAMQVDPSVNEFLAREMGSQHTLRIANERNTQARRKLDYEAADRVVKGTGSLQDTVRYAGNLMQYGPDYHTVLNRYGGKFGGMPGTVAASVQGAGAPEEQPKILTADMMTVSKADLAQWRKDNPNETTKEGKPLSDAAIRKRIQKNWIDEYRTEGFVAGEETPPVYKAMLLGHSRSSADEQLKSGEPLSEPGKHGFQARPSHEKLADLMRQHTMSKETEDEIYLATLRRINSKRDNLPAGLRSRLDADASDLADQAVAAAKAGIWGTPRNEESATGTVKDTRSLEQLATELKPNTDELTETYKNRGVYLAADNAFDQWKAVEVKKPTKDALAIAEPLGERDVAASGKVVGTERDSDTLLAEEQGGELPSELEQKAEAEIASREEKLKDVEVPRDEDVGTEDMPVVRNPARMKNKQFAKRLLEDINNELGLDVEDTEAQLSDVMLTKTAGSELLKRLENKLQQAQEVLHKVRGDTGDARKKERGAANFLVEEAKKPIARLEKLAENLRNVINTNEFSHSLLPTEDFVDVVKAAYGQNVETYRRQPGKYVIKYKTRKGENVIEGKVEPEEGVEPRFRVPYEKLAEKPTFKTRDERIEFERTGKRETYKVAEDRRKLWQLAREIYNSPEKWRKLHDRLLLNKDVGMLEQLRSEVEWRNMQEQIAFERASQEDLVLNPENPLASPLQRPQPARELTEKELLERGHKVTPEGKLIPKDFGPVEWARASSPEPRPPEAVGKPPEKLPYSDKWEQLELRAPKQVEPDISHYFEGEKGGKLTDVGSPAQREAALKARVEKLTNDGLRDKEGNKIGPDTLTTEEAAKVLAQPEYAVELISSTGKRVMQKSTAQREAYLEKLLAAKKAGKSTEQMSVKGAGAPETPEFKAWFGDSKVVDKDGKPLVVYHGTPSEGDFNAYDVTKLGNGKFGRGVYLTDNPDASAKYGDVLKPLYATIKNPFYARLDDGVSLTDFKKTLRTTWEALKPKLRKSLDRDHQAMSDQFAEDMINDPNNYRTKDYSRDTSSRALYHAFEFFDKNWPRLLGHDGMIVDVNPEMAYGATKEYVAYSPSQIKSATGNVGTYDPNNPDIRYSSKGAGPTEPTDAPSEVPFHSMVPPFMRGVIPKVQRKFPEVGKALEEAAIKTSRLTGEFVSDPIRRMKKHMTVLRNGRDNETWKNDIINEDSPTLRRVHDWRKALEDTGVEPYKLSPEEEYVNDAVNDMYRRSWEEQIRLGKKPEGSEGKPGYVSQHFRADINEAVRADRNGAKAQEAIAKQEQYLRDQGLSEKRINDLMGKWLGGMSKKVSNSAEQFGPIDESEGYGIHPDLRETNLLKIVNRFGKRSAQRLGYVEHIENNKDVFNRLFDNKTGVSTDEDVSNALDELNGRREEHEVTRMAVAQVIKNLMMGTGTGLRDMTTTFPVGMRHMAPEQIISAAVAGIKNFRENFAETFRKNINKENLVNMDYNMLDEGTSKFNNLAIRFAAVVNKVQLRNLSEQASRTFAYGTGKYLAADAVAHGEPKGQRAEFVKNFFPDGVASDSPKAIEEAAARYVESVQSTYSYRDLPAIAQKGSLAPFLSLSRWSIGQLNNFDKFVYRPAREGNYMPLAMSTLGMLIGGAAVEALNELMMNRKSKLPTVSEIKASDNMTKAAMYKLAGLASMSGFAGFYGDLAKTAGDFSVGNRPQELNNPLLTGMHDTLTLGVQYLQALADGQGVQAAELMSQILQTYSQNMRYALNNMREEKMAKQDEFRDYKVWKQFNRPDVIAPVETLPNPFMRVKEKQFKQTADINEAAELLPELLSDAASRSESPEDWKSSMQRLKANSYQSMPSPTRSTTDFARYMDYLNKTQGADKASERYANYERMNAINKTKAAMVP